MTTPDNGTDGMNLRASTDPAGLRRMTAGDIRDAEFVRKAVAGRARAESEAERRELLSQLHRELAERIRQHRFSAEEKRRAWNEVKESLSRTLAIDNPRFDRSQKIE